MKIMLGYHDFIPDSRILTTAIDHVRAFKAQLFLVTSMEIGEGVPKSEFDTAEENLEKGKHFFLDHGIDCVTHLVETGLLPGETLVQFALEHKIDEMIIGVRSRSKLGKLIFGSTAQYVILNASCPVVTILHED